MDLSYDREQTARAYDEYGEQEWDRHERRRSTVSPSTCTGIT